MTGERKAETAKVEVKGTDDDKNKNDLVGLIKNYVVFVSFSFTFCSKYEL